MLEKTKNNLEIVEEKGIKNSLIYVKGLKVNEESYETKILLEENIQNVLKYQIVYDGAETLLSFDVSNTIGLDEYIKIVKLKKKDICNILDSIDDLLSNIENYLISEDSISLDLKLVRVKRNLNNNFELRFCILPNLKTSFSYELSRFLIKILRFVDIDDKNALQLAYGLFVRSSKDNYTINDLMELVDAAREKKRNAFKDIDIEALSEYDDEIVSEIHDEILENDVSMNTPELSDFIDAENNIDVILDKNTTDILKEEVLDKFDDEPNVPKVIKFKKKLFDFKPKKTLNAYVNFKLAKVVLFPISCIIVPMVFYLCYGPEKLISFIPLICLYEIIILTLYVIKNIMKSK